MPCKISFFSCRTVLVQTLITVIFTSTAHSQLRQVFKDDLVETNEVRKISFSSPSTGYVAFKDWIGFTTDSGRTFTRKYITTSNVNFNGYSDVNITFGFGISGVYVFDQNNIIAYGDYGLVPAILRSTDGGNSFLLVYHSQLYPTVLRTGITDLVFPGNGNTGIAVDADRILRSTDKGITWTVSNLYPNRRYTELNVIDNNTVFAIAPTHDQTGSLNYFFKTTDAGASWAFLIAPKGNVTCINFLTATKGWANVDGKIYYSSNGGVNWTLKNDSAVTPITAHKMRFVNDYTGYALSDQFEVYKTTDSGRIWEQVERDNDFTWLGYTHNDLQVLNDDQLWAGGRHGFLELNTNSSAAPLPGAYFNIDTTGMTSGAKVVQLKNYSKTNYTYQWIVNGVPAGTSYNSSYSHDIYLASDTVKLIVSDGVHSDTTEKVHYFDAVPYPPPVVNSFLPAVAAPGTQVTITGNFFSKVTGVSFGGIPASSFKVQSLTTIVAVVGAGGNGKVAVTTATGTGFITGFLTSPPPVITGLSPAYAPVGAIVTITGSNFGATPAENLVVFGGVKAKVLTAAPGQLTVHVPAGASYAPVTVTVNNHTGYSMQWFSITFPATCGLTEYSFDKGKKLPTAVAMSTTITLGVADFDGDGRNDIGVNRYDVHILLNKSTKGSIDFQKVIVEGFSPNNYDPTATAAADLDGDGKPDLVTGNYNGYEIKIYRNTSSIGSLSFEAPIKMTHMAAPFNIILQDVDGDGKPDMITNNIGLFANHVSIYRNISLPGNIAFEPVQEVKIGNSANRMCMADLDSDGKPDLFVNDWGGTSFSTFTILRNTSSIGSISFDRVQVPHYSALSADGAVGDVDGDGKLDIAITHDTWNTIGTQKSLVIYKNNSTPGSISFTPVPVDDSTTNSKYHVALSDLDGDGKIDLYASGGLKLMKNTGSPGNISLVPVSSYFSPIGGATNVPNTDWDNDSRPDLILTSNSALYVFRNIMEPDALAGKDTTICEGQPVKLGGTWDAPDQTYAWTSSPAGFTSAVANPIVNPTVSTDYFVSVTNKFGCVSKDTIHITVGGPSPLVNAGADETLCAGATRQIGMTGVAPNTYSWASVPEGFSADIPNPVVTPTSPQIDYILTVNTGNCIVRDTVHFTVGSFATADAGPDRNICMPNVVTIGTAAIGSNSYSWTSNPAGYTSTQARPTVTPSTTSTTYYLQVTTQLGCKSYDTVQVEARLSPSAATVTASGPLSFCQGGSVTLTSSATSDIQWLNNGNIMPGITTPSITVTQNGSYTVRRVNDFCYSYSQPSVVTVNTIPATPQITTGGNTTFCQGSSVVLTSSATQGNQWSKDGVDMPGITTQSITVTQSGSYIVRAVNGNCSAASTPVVVTVNPAPPAPQITVSGSTTFCWGGIVQFTSSVAQGNQWYNNGVAIAGAMGDIFRVASSGVFSLRYTLNGCLSQESVKIPVYVSAGPPTPVITQSGNNLVSSSDTANQWYLNNVAIPGATGKTWQPVTAGVYTVSVTQTGCTPVFSAPFNYTITAINEPAWGNSLTVSPNPVLGSTEIKYTGNSTRFTATVTDVNGHEVKTQGLFINSCILDLRSLNAGVYVIRVYNVTTKEFINRVIVKM